jgi:chromosome segregation ATPase
LTKHLRAYCGTGVFEDKKIGRMMRSLAFSGKGLVRNPGNIESVVINDVDAFKGVFASIEKDPIIINRGEGSMSDNSEKLVQLESSNRELHGEVADLRDRLKKMDEEKVTAAFKVKDDEITSLKSEAAELQKTLDESVAAKNEADKELEDLKAAKAEVDKQLEESKAELDKIASEAKQIERVASLVDAGLEKEDAETLASKFESANDEMFEVVVAQQREHAEAIKEFEKKPISSAKKDNKDSISKPKKDNKTPIATASDENDDEANDSSDEAIADAADLDDIEGGNADASLATAGETEEDKEDKKMEALSNFLGGQLAKNHSK